ncbi:MAG: Ig-like domain-containing protein, partial [Bacilli bacterium]|nr:Ig-like domain-containing protein [Bacilli bacterium]
MKIKVLVILFIVAFTSMILFGCKKEEKKIYFDQNEIEIIVGEEYIIDINLQGLSGDVTYSLSNDNVELRENVIVGKVEGDAIINAKLNFDGKEYSASLTVKVLPIPVSSIEISGKDRMLVGNEHLNSQTLSANVLPAKAGSKELTWTSSNENIATVSNKGVVNAVSAGEVTITATSVITPSVSGTITITVYDNDTSAPVVTLDDGTNTLSVKIDEKYDLLAGVHATDDLEGDISSKITVDTSEFNKYVPGTYDVYYSATDEAGNVSSKVKRTYTIVYDSYVEFIGHAGCYYGLMNSEEAFINAGKRGYQLVECDLKQTSDGVFVLSHDDDFDGTAIASTTYANLKKITKTATRGGVSYTTTICTLERYLEICKEYGMKAVIELKYSNGINNNSQSRMQALMNEIEKCGMLEEVVFLGSQYNCLIWVKENGYDYIPCQYLVNSIESADVLNRCNTYDLDISFNVDGGSNSSDWIMRYIDAGHKVSCWTFSQYSTAETLQKWIDLNLIDYFTCDVLTAADVKLPKAKEVEAKQRFNVKFYDYDDTLIKTSSTVEGQKAVSPVDPKRDGYTFKGWDTDFSNVTGNLDVHATYDINTYTIAYNPNNTQIEEKTFENKEAFVSEFYNDLFDWINANRDKM